MTPYKPAFSNRQASMGQSPLPMISPSSAPPAVGTVDAVFAGYEGVPGILASIALLGVTASAAYVGIKTGLNSQDTLMKAAGWVGGVGSALMGLFYLGQKSGLSIGTPVPSLSVYPS